MTAQVPTTTCTTPSALHRSLLWKPTTEKADDSCRRPSQAPRESNLASRASHDLRSLFVRLAIEDQSSTLLAAVDQVSCGLLDIVLVMFYGGYMDWAYAI